MIINHRDTANRVLQAFPERIADRHASACNTGWNNNIIKLHSADPGQRVILELFQDTFAAEFGLLAAEHLERALQECGLVLDLGAGRALDEVVEHYSSKVTRSPMLDPNLAKHPEGGLQLSVENRQALVAFLKTLTDEKYQQPRTSVASPTTPTASP